MVSELEINNNDRILIIAPHPDDECIGCGGLICLYPSLCDVILLTDGARSGKRFSQEGMAARREKEFTNEMIDAGVANWEVKRYANSELIDSPRCCENIDFNRYTIVFLPMLEDDHIDHVSAYVYAMREIRKQKYRGSVYEYEIEKSMENADTYLDIVACMDRKISLIRHHKSQLEIKDYDEITLNRDRNHRQKCGVLCDYSELYRKVSVEQERLEDRVLDTHRLRWRINSVEYILDKWTELFLQGRSIADRIINYGVSSLCIYGFSYFGRMLYYEAVNRGIEVRYIIDQNTCVSKPDNTRVFPPDGFFGDADIVVITTIKEVDTIKRKLYSFGYNRVVSLFELIEA